MQFDYRNLSAFAGLPARRLPLVALLRGPLLLAAVVLALTTGAVRAAEESKRVEVVKTAVSTSALQPGKAAMAAVVVDIKKGYHSQSHSPVKPYYIAFNLTLEANTALKFGDPVFPPGEDYDTKGALGVLNVYEGKVVVRFPVEVKSDAAPADVKIKGKVRLQVCDDNVCYAPATLPVEIATSVVAPGQEVKPNEPELFPAAATQPAAVPPAPPKAKAADYTIWGAFAAAFLAGLLFNVMPCVLPVLPLKAMGFYEASQHNRARTIWLGTGFSLGVIASFAALGLLVLFKPGFKWGLIFSNPWFLGGLVLVLLLMGLYTFGLFAIRLPTAIYSVSPRHDTFFGNVLFGILTAALSTPCTFGLFVGLLAFAITTPKVVGMLLMVTVGVGMAFPYFVLSAFPEAARRFPRTRPWAELVKQFLGIVLVVTAIYFADAFVEKVIPSRVFWWLLFALVVGAAVFLVVKSVQFSKSALGPTVAVLFALALVVPAYRYAHRLTLRPYTWQSYSPEVLAAARASNQVVVLEFTASWCTTCHGLEAEVLHDPDVVETVNQYGVTMMRADVTAEDAPGWTKIRELHAEGVPLTAVYAPGSAEPVQLAGLYRSRDLRGAIAEASKQKPAPTVAQGG